METKFISLPIDSIIVDPQRQRKDLGDLSSLARSIERNGLINPITVTHDYILIAGERRLTTCRDHLNHTHIMVGIREEEPTTDQRMIELAENVERLELDWKDRCFAVKEYHDLALADDPDWDQRKTAHALNLGSDVVSRHIALAIELEKGTELICNAQQYSVARGILERIKERREQANKDKLREMLGTPKPVVDSRTIDVEEYIGELDAKLPTGTSEAEPDSAGEDEPTPLPSGVTPFRCSDFNRFASTYTGTPFNFIHCDFPYGVNANKHNLGAAKSFGGYADSADVYWRLIDSLGNAMDTLVAEDAHMMFWYSMDYHAETVAALTSFGWKVNPFPLIWFKSDNSGILPDPKRGPRRNYETALLCTRGDRKIIQAVSNVCPHPNTKAIHMSEKPIGMLRHFFRMFVDETTTILDPTMGSGNAIVLAEHLGARLCRGLEMDKGFYETARDAYLAGKYDLGDA